MKELRVNIKVEYDSTDLNQSQVDMIDEIMKQKISSIGGKWWAQGTSFVEENKRLRDVAYDINIRV